MRLTHHGNRLCVEVMSRSERGRGGKERERERENRFPFSGARLPLAQRSLISFSPNSTVTFFLLFFRYSPFIHLPYSNVHHVLFRSRDQHCCGSVLCSVAFFSFQYSHLPFPPCFSNSRRNDYVLLIILDISIHTLSDFREYMHILEFEFENGK